MDLSRANWMVMRPSNVSVEARALGLPGEWRMAFREVDLCLVSCGYLAAMLVLFVVLGLLRWRYALRVHPLHLL